MTTEYIGRENIGPEGYLQPTRYRITCKCLRCGHEFSRITTKLSGNDPPCPKKACKEALIEEEVERRTANFKAMLESGHPPAQIGNKPIVAAIDRTAEITMQDHGLTDLQDNIRQGDIMAPKLPAPMQRQVDGFFNGSAVKGAAGTRMAKRMNALGQRALAGGYRHMAADIPSILPGKPGESALRFVGNEKLK